MLVLDAFTRHLTPEVQAIITGSSMNTDLMVISGGMTSQVQVLDVVNRLFTDHLRQHYSEQLLTGDHTLTPVGRMDKSSEPLLFQWIIAA
jgi:hypothetical protein